MEALTSKKDSYRLFRAGGFGNRLREWGTVAEWVRDGKPGPVSLRTLGTHTGQRLCTYHLDADALSAEMLRWRSLGVPESNMVIGEMAPDHLFVLQGEYTSEVLPEKLVQCSSCGGRGIDPWGNYDCQDCGGKGTVWTTSTGFLYFSRVQKPMREAFEKDRKLLQLVRAYGATEERISQLRDHYHAHGLRARLLLKEAMTPSSWEDFQVLLDRYPDHAIEVSVYSRPLGNTPGRNAIVWEVRRY